MQTNNEPASTGPVQAIVSTRFVECPFPETVRLSLISQGGMPMKAVLWKRQNDVAYGMLSFEPCGDNGEFQKHLSISASSRDEGRRMPTDEEVTAAADACGLQLSECEVLRQNQVVHLFRTSC